MKWHQGVALSAVLATSAGVASAQSSVTLYGVADVGVEYLTNAPAGNGDGSVFRMSSGNMSTSRWGLRGKEDLGGGLSAIFELESGFSLDNGTTSSRLFDRSSFVGLSGGFGKLTLGRQTTPLYDTAILLDPMGFAPRYGLYRSDDILAGRADNAIKYSNSFSGLTVSGLYSFGRTGTGEVAGQSKVDRNFGGSLHYANAAMTFGLAYDEFQGTSIATQDNKDRRLLAGASYAFGPVRAFAGYRWLKGSVATGSDFRSNLYWLGARYQATPALSLAGAAYYTDTRNSKADPMMFVVSGDYMLSKRTDLYLNVAYARNKDGSQLGLNGYGSVVAGENQTGAVAGIRHRF